MKAGSRGRRDPLARRRRRRRRVDAGGEVGLPSATRMPGRVRSQTAVSAWWSLLCSPSGPRRGSSTTGLPYSAAVITVPIPAWATTSARPRDRREIVRPLQPAHPGHVGGLEAAVADLRQHLPPRVRGGPGVHRPDQPVEGEHRADGHEDHEDRPRSRSGPSGRARCSHCTSQASATGRAIRPDSDIRSVLATESIQTVRLPARSLPSPSATKPGAAPVVTTASGRSRRTARRAARGARQLVRVRPADVATR